MIDSYNLKWDSGDGTWVDLMGQDGSFSLDLQHIQSDGVTAGVSYSFTVRAHNAHGWGIESEPAIIVAAQSPEKPTPPTSTVHNHFVKVSWVPPYENSAPINGYEIFIGDDQGVFLHETTYCDGRNEPVFSQLYCEIPMAALHTDPYNLPFDSEVQAKVKASNMFGESPVSEVSTVNARIQTVPQKVQNLVKLPTTTQSNIDFQWDELVTLEETGGTEILSYHVEWDRGSAGLYFLNLAGYVAIYDDTSYSITAHVTTGVSYQVRVRAKNYWGWGEYSDIFTIKASSVPERVDTVTTAIDEATGGLRVEWTAPFDNSDEIIAYSIEAQEKDGDWTEICDGTDPTVVSTQRCI